MVKCPIFQAMAWNTELSPDEKLAVIFAKFHVFPYKITDLKHMFIVISSVLQHIYFILEYILSKILFIGLEQKEVANRNYSSMIFLEHFCS